MKLLCKKDCFSFSDNDVLYFKNGNSYDVLKKFKDEYTVIDETNSGHIVSNETDDIFLDTYFEVTY